MGWVAAVDFKRSGAGCAVQPRTNSGKIEKLHNGVVIGAVANGGEQAALGHVGARTSVQAALAMLRQDSDLLSRMLVGKARPRLEALFAKVTEAVGEAIVLSAVAERRIASDFATSLTVFFACPFGLAAMQVGRSLLVYRPPDGDYDLVFEVADTIGGIECVTGPNAVSCMRVGYMRGPVEFLCVASRAIERLYITGKNRHLSEPFFRLLDRYISGALDDGDVHRGIREFLRASDLSRDIDEDLTLALCRYNPTDRLALGLR